MVNFFHEGTSLRLEKPRSVFDITSIVEARNLSLRRFMLWYLFIHPELDLLTCETTRQRLINALQRLNFLDKDENMSRATAEVIVNSRNMLEVFIKLGKINPMFLGGRRNNSYIGERQFPILKAILQEKYNIST